MATTESKAITLEGDELAQALEALERINLSAAAIHRLAQEVGVDPGSAWFAYAIEDVAQTICRRCEVAGTLLGNPTAFGNFADEFQVRRRQEGASSGEQQ
jgi:hypothetical protein